MGTTGLRTGFNFDERQEENNDRPPLGKYWQPAKPYVPISTKDGAQYHGTVPGCGPSAAALLMGHHATALVNVFVAATRTTYLACYCPVLARATKQQLPKA